MIDKLRLADRIKVPFTASALSKAVFRPDRFVMHRTPRSRTSLLSALGIFIAAALGASAARAAECPGNPDALGTSRTIVVDPKEHPRIGTMQYGETLPLEDHEVVLTFDDGPLPAHTNAVLDILAAQCVKATFFMVGRMAKEFPQDVRRVHDAGHTIGTHSENHPTFFGKLPPERMASEIDDGITHVGTALGDASQLAPFFRIPGLRRGDLLEAELGKRGLMTWSADFPADDWRHISSAQVVHFALSRLEAKGKGVLLLHDIQARTQAALPVILRELKAPGYRIVHVVPATPERLKTPTDPAQWIPYWIHNTNIAGKSYPGFAFGMYVPHSMPQHNMQRSERAVWLARQRPNVTWASASLLRPSPNLFQIAGKRMTSDISAASQPRSLARLPGSWPIRPDNGAFRPITDPIKTGSRTDMPAGPNIR